MTKIKKKERNYSARNAGGRIEWLTSVWLGPSGYRVGPPDTGPREATSTLRCPFNLPGLVSFVGHNWRPSLASSFHLVFLPLLILVLGREKIDNQRKREREWRICWGFSRWRYWGVLTWPTVTPRAATPTSSSAWAIRSYRISSHPFRLRDPYILDFSLRVQSLDWFSYHIIMIHPTYLITSCFWTSLMGAISRSVFSRHRFFFFSSTFEADWGLFSHNSNRNDFVVICLDFSSGYRLRMDLIKTMAILVLFDAEMIEMILLWFVLLVLHLIYCILWKMSEMIETCLIYCFSTGFFSGSSTQQFDILILF